MGPALILGAIVIYIIIQLVAGYRSTSSEHICTVCGTRGSDTVTPGSMLTEIFLWLCFLVPGLIYSIWRISARHEACPKCRSRAIIPTDTPAGRELALKYPEPTSQK
jgi:hypothetical protein